MANVEDFDLERLISRRDCSWPGCTDKGIVVAVGRTYDGKRMYHCARHHGLVFGHPQTYPVIQDRDIELSRWEGEGGCCEQ